MWLNSRWAVVRISASLGRLASVGFISIGGLWWVDRRRWVVVWLVCCSGSGGFRGGGCGCCLVGRVGVGLVDFFFSLLWWWQRRLWL